MQLSLSAAEVETLRELLTGYLSNLRMEIARTDSKEFRVGLREREQLVERLVTDLGRQDA